MNTQPDNSSGGAGNGARPVILIGIMAAVGLAVLAAVLTLKSKSPAPGSEAAAGAAPVTAPAEGTSHAPAAGVQPGNASALGAAPGTTTATTGAVAHAGAEGLVSVKDLIKTLKDASLPMSQRKAAIEALAKLGTPEAVAALKEALNGGSDELRSAIAEGRTCAPRRRRVWAKSTSRERWKRSPGRP